MRTSIFRRATDFDVDPQTLTDEEKHKWLVVAIVPLPIACATALLVNGRSYAASFSTFTPLSTVPPIISVSVSVSRKGSEWRDTARDMLVRREFAVSIGTLAAVGDLPLSKVSSNATASHRTHQRGWR